VLLLFCETFCVADLLLVGINSMLVCVGVADARNRLSVVCIESGNYSQLMCNWYIWNLVIVIN
jgi:hypothetical protein